MALSHVMNIISNAGAVSAGTGSGSGGGGSSNLDSQTVTVGSSTSASGGSGAPAGTTVRRGYSGIYSIGSVSDGTSNLYSGALFSEIQYTWDTIYPISAFTLRIVGASRANSGWTTLTIGSTAARAIVQHTLAKILRLGIGTAEAIILVQLIHSLPLGKPRLVCLHKNYKEI